MRIARRDPASGSYTLQIETDDDVWHLYNIVEPGDLVTASTVRREERAADKIRAERAEKRRMTLGVRVEKAELSDSDMRLKILGVIETGPQDVGQHHTLVAEPGERVTVSKARWRETQLERVRRAVEDAAKPRIAFVSLDQDEATVAVMRQSGLKEVATIRSMRSGKQYQEREAQGDYHGEIIGKLSSVMSGGMPLVVLGPGFEKELLAEDGKRRAPELFSKAHVYHTGQSGMQGVNELLKKGMGSDILRRSRVGIEMEAVERLMEEIGRDGLAAYGTEQVAAAAAAGAVETLLILDSRLRGGDYDRMVRDTESQKGSVVVVSEKHDAGAQLASLGGFAALLRYKARSGAPAAAASISQAIQPFIRQIVG